MRKVAVEYSNYSLTVTMVVSFRVYKKSSPNGKLTVYLGRRDFVDHVSKNFVKIICLIFGMAATPFLCNGFLLIGSIYLGLT